MKTKILWSAFLSLCALNVASAEVIRCDGAAKGDYLIALDGDSGLVFSNADGYFKAEAGKVTVARAMDGGPTHVDLTPEIGKINWKKEKNCFVMGDARTIFTIDIDARGDSGSTMFYAQNVVLRPGATRATCSVPIGMMAPQKIRCEYIK